MEILAYIAALFVGISLGLIGAGGSILTVPVLVYLLGVNPVIAATCSLFTVGTTCLVGSVRAWYADNIQVRTVYHFGLPSLVTAFVVHKWVLPLVPDPIVHTDQFLLSKGTTLMLLFGMLMMVVAWRMIRSTVPQEAQAHTDYIRSGLAGVLTGLVTGLLGAGGGFLIIPALVLWLKLPMKKAIGTSLAIMTINTLITFAGTYHALAIPWHALLIFTGVAVGGMFIGQAIGMKMPGEKLRPGFGWFILAMGVYIIGRELYMLF